MSITFSKTRISYEEDIKVLEREEQLVYRTMWSSDIKPWEKVYLEAKSRRIRQRIDYLLSNYETWKKNSI